MFSEAYFKARLKECYYPNKFGELQSCIRLYSAVFDTTYYYTSDCAFLSALSKHLFNSGFVYGSDFLFYREPGNYIFYFATQASALSFIVFHNGYYPFSPIPVPFSFYPIDQVLSLISAKKVRKNLLVSFSDTLLLNSYSTLNDNQFGITQDFSVFLSKHN